MVLEVQKEGDMETLERQISRFDIAGAVIHCQTAATIFVEMGVSPESLHIGFKNYVQYFHGAMRGKLILPENVLTGLLAFIREVDITLMRGRCELEIYEKYHWYAEKSLITARSAYWFCRAAREVLENEMFMI